VIKFKISEHAKEQIQERDIPLVIVLNVINNPGQKYNNDIDETVCQSTIFFDGKAYLCKTVCKFYKESTRYYQ
jgi:hypothetical protein